MTGSTVRCLPHAVITRCLRIETTKTQEHFVEIAIVTNQLDTMNFAIGRNTIMHDEAIDAIRRRQSLVDQGADRRHMNR